MHEYSIVQALLQQVESHARAHGAVAVHRVLVKIGELSGVETELLRTAYATFRERTVCRDADLDVQLIPARWKCPSCRADLSGGVLLRCHACGTPARLERGDEIVLERIEMEVM